MKFPTLFEPDPVPLPMTLEQYLDFCEFSLQFSCLDRIREQKEREEQITTPFRWVPLRGDTSLIEPPSTNH
ncbi:MAG TPA: hypothetical protein PKE26_06285 [Kiritimatiellia bacterium]|nr:hypothetical protein [Kiritimatiellia bacterium]HMO98701.1 hypothetical protein [Kiritimatiellia bacterium]